jgi:hypothetical protein
MAAKRSLKYAVLAVAILALACLSLTFPGRHSDFGTASGGGGAGGGEVELLETTGKRRDASGAAVAAKEIAKASAQDSALEAKITQARQIKDSLSSQVEESTPMCFSVPRHSQSSLPLLPGIEPAITSKILPIPSSQNALPCCLSHGSSVLDLIIALTCHFAPADCGEGHGEGHEQRGEATPCTPTRDGERRRQAEGDDKDHRGRRGETPGQL